MSRKRNDFQHKDRNEIYVSYGCTLGKHLGYANHLFNDGYTRIYISGLGYAMADAVRLGMAVRRKFKGIHSVSVLDIVNIRVANADKKVPRLTVTISKTPLETNDKTYLPPLPDSEVKQYQPFAFHSKIENKKVTEDIKDKEPKDEEVKEKTTALEDEKSKVLNENTEKEPSNDINIDVQEDDEYNYIEYQRPIRSRRGFRRNYYGNRYQSNLNELYWRPPSRFFL